MQKQIKNSGLTIREFKSKIKNKNLEFESKKCELSCFLELRKIWINDEFIKELLNKKVNDLFHKLLELQNVLNSKVNDNNDSNFLNFKNIINSLNHYLNEKQINNIYEIFNDLYTINFLDINNLNVIDKLLDNKINFLNGIFDIAKSYKVSFNKDAKKYENNIENIKSEHQKISQEIENIEIKIKEINNDNLDSAKIKSDFQIQLNNQKEALQINNNKMYNIQINIDDINEKIRLLDNTLNYKNVIKNKIENLEEMKNIISDINDNPNFKEIFNILSKNKINDSYLTTSSNVVSTLMQLISNNKY